MTNHVTISIPKREKPVWDAWKKYPANKNTSAALMRLVRNARLRKGETEESLGRRADESLYEIKKRKKVDRV